MALNIHNNKEKILTVISLYCKKKKKKKKKKKTILLFI